MEEFTVSAGFQLCSDTSCLCSDAKFPLMRNKTLNFFHIVLNEYD